jgi:hypothetical protein
MEDMATPIIGGHLTGLTGTLGFWAGSVCFFVCRFYNWILEKAKDFIKKEGLHKINIDKKIFF